MAERDMVDGSFGGVVFLAVAIAALWWFLTMNNKKPNLG